MPCGWEGNRRSGVALAMRYRLQWFIHLRAQGLRKGDEHPAYTPQSWGTAHFTLYVTGYVMYPSLCQYYISNQLTSKFDFFCLRIWAMTVARTRAKFKSRS